MKDKRAPARKNAGQLDYLGLSLGTTILCSFIFERINVKNNLNKMLSVLQLLRYHENVIAILPLCGEFSRCHEIRILNTAFYRIIALIEYDILMLGIRNPTAVFAVNYKQSFSRHTVKHNLADMHQSFELLVIGNVANFKTNAVGDVMELKIDRLEILVTSHVNSI